MTTWLSVEDIAKEFNLETHVSEPEVLRTEIKKILTELHPDKSGGTFKSDKEKERFLRAKSALEFLDIQAQNINSLIPISLLPAVIKAVSDAITARPPADITTLQSTAILETRHHLSRRFAGPKIGSGVFAAITAFLVTFSDKFETHPILGPFLNNRTTRLLLLSLMACSGMFFLFTWFRERRAEARAEYLMSESALHAIFEMISMDARTNPEPGRVSSRQILESVQVLGGVRSRYTSSFFLLFCSGVDLATSEKAAQLQTQRLLEKKLITRLNLPSVDTWYEIQIQ